MLPRPRTTDITGLILAGGRATRMQRREKGLQQLDGISLVERVITRLLPQVGTIAINANSNLDAYQRFGFPVWSDHGADESAPIAYNGPLDGVATGLRHCSTPYLLVVPCDCPFLPQDLADRLMTALDDDHADIAVATSGIAAEPRMQPTFCLMRVTVLPQLQDYLRNGGRRMDGWYGSAKVVHARFADEAQFINLNTLEDLERHTVMLRNTQN